MKALSIRQPWAWLILARYKRVENRAWGTSYRGRFYVHASQRFDATGYAWVREKFPQIALPQRDAFDYGGIVGTAELIDCVGPGSEYPSAWYDGAYGFVLANAEFTTFQPCKGRLGFFVPGI